MQHLDTDRLAALADESPTPDESAHLAACLVCRGERDAYVALLDLAHREGTAHAAAGGGPMSSWDAISATLRDEGLVREAPAPAPAFGGRVQRAQPIRSTAVFWRRAAAAVTLVAGGAALGRATVTHAPATPSVTSATQVASAEPTVATTAAVPAPPPSPSVGLSDTIPVNGEPASRARFASQSVTPTDFSGTAEAMQVLARAQQDYQRAAAYLAEHDSTAASGSPQALRARLAALDEVMPKVREALYEAPQDPVLNQYYLTTYDVRESTLRQLGRVLPVGVRLNGY